MTSIKKDNKKVIFDRYEESDDKFGIFNLQDIENKYRKKLYLGEKELIEKQKNRSLSGLIEKEYKTMRHHFKDEVKLNDNNEDK